MGSFPETYNDLTQAGGKPGNEVTKLMCSNQCKSLKMVRCVYLKGGTGLSYSNRRFIL